MSVLGYALRVRLARWLGPTLSDLGCMISRRWGWPE